jgi:hypothetical protein
MRTNPVTSRSLISLARIFCLLAPSWLAGSVAAPLAGPDVLVVADAKATSAPEFSPPTPERPVYYYLVGQKEHTVGHLYAGEKLPKPEIIETEVVKALARRGYVRTQVGGPAPSLFVMVAWGTSNAAVEQVPGEDGFSVLTNEREMDQLTGANKADQKQEVDPRENEKIAQRLQEYRVYLMIGAFDAVALTKKEKKLVWRTTMSIDTLRHSFPASLATMLESGAPYFGRNTDRAVDVNDAARRTASVTIAPFKVLEEDVRASATAKPAGK